MKGLLPSAECQGAIKLNNKFKTIWLIQSKCFQLVSKQFISELENEELALEMEKFTFMFPLLFPQENITRKMHVFSMILPGFVRKFKMAYLMLKLEQYTESMHNKLNQAEIRNRNIKNSGKRLLNCIQQLENNKKMQHGFIQP